MTKDKEFESLKPEDRLGGLPVQERYKKLMTEVMKGLDEIFNGTAKADARHTGIVMFVFPYNDQNGRVNYMSNGANRADVIRMFEEQIRRFKADSDDDLPMLEHMAAAIRRLCVVDGQPLVNEVTSMAAAATCLLIYRKGPEAFAPGSEQKQ